MYADKGYDSREVRRLLVRAHFVPRVFARRIRTHRALERRRNVVERFFAWLDGFRRLLMRHEALLHTFRSMHMLACALILGKMTSSCFSVWVRDIARTCDTM